MRSSLARQSLSLTTTLPQSIPVPTDPMETMVDSRVRWAQVHRQARKIAATNEARRMAEAEIQAVEERARQAVREAKNARVFGALIFLCAVALGCMLFR